MTAYDAMPWLSLYPEGESPELHPPEPDALSLFRAALAAAPDAPAVIYFDAVLSWAELDRLSDALAVLLQRHGFARGDRLACALQNVPHVPVAMLAAWKAGGCLVPVNPMNRERELSLILSDCAPRALIGGADFLDGAAARVEASLLPPLLLAVSPFDFQRRDDPRAFPGMTRPAAPDARDLLRALSPLMGEAPPRHVPSASDPGMLVYTSGTTGQPKGAIITHANLAADAAVSTRWFGLRAGEPMLALAPLFHITGAVCHAVTGMCARLPIILLHRFEPGLALSAALEHRPTCTIAAITAYIAMMSHADARREHFATVERPFSGGAPVPAEVARRFHAQFGHVLRNAYGMTETTAVSHGVPLGREGPVDPESGTLSVGVPVYGVRCWIAREDGTPADVGEVGEIVTLGPMVSPGYWNKPAETAATMRADGLRSGDVGFMDARGWFFLVDRKKDMIVASGFKVWPREVEDVLYTHPAVREAAVVGVPDAYRGETVRAVVSLRPGHAVADGELATHCRERMAAYKVPRVVEVMAELPKTATGKIMRRALR